VILYHTRYLVIFTLKVKINTVNGFLCVEINEKKPFTIKANFYKSFKESALGISENIII